MTPKAIEYVQSVDGAAHLSAVRIIEELEAEVAAFKATQESDTERMDMLAQKVLDLKAALSAEGRLDGALAASVEGEKNGEKC